MQEETGYKIKIVNERIGIIIERSLDKFEENSIFEMTSYYYFCEPSDLQVEQNLDDYEEAQNFSPIWVEIKKVIIKNELILQEEKKDMNEWVYRETLALKEIDKILDNNQKGKNNDFIV